MHETKVFLKGDQKTNYEIDIKFTDLEEIEFKNFKNKKNTGTSYCQN